MKNKLLALALAAGCTFHAHAAELGKSQALSSPDQVPEGLEKSDWQSIRQAYHAAQFRSAVNAGLTTQQAYLKASNTGADDRFGYSVAVSGDTVVVGAFQEDSNAVGVNGNPANESAADSGAVYVFTRSAGAWSQQAYLKASNTGASDYFGYSVAVSGDTIIVGAMTEYSGATGVNGDQADNTVPASGAAYVFVRSGAAWSQQAYLKASNPGILDLFGGSVSISGDTIVIAAVNESSIATGINGNQVNDSALAAGAVYVFVRSGAAWTQQAFLKASNTGAEDQFGKSVAVSGDTVVVGASGEDSNATGVGGNQIDNSSGFSGAAYIFVRSGATWSQQAYLKASNTGAGDQFGASVAVFGDTVVVGAGNEDSNATGINGNQIDNSTETSGAAYVFVRSGSTWSQQAYLKASNTGASDQFGYSVAISGDTVVVGAPREASGATGINGNQTNESAAYSGAAYVFTRSAGAWSQQAYLKASNTGADDSFGTSVAVSGATIVVGSNYEDSITSGINSIPNDAGAADNSGAAYIFTFPVPEPPVVKYLVKVKLNQAKFGKVTGIGSFATGSKVTLKAKAKKGHKFLGWYEKKKLITKKPVLVIKKLTKNRSLVAKFK